jgi:DNA-binding CsgD family transcriptional regulator
VGEARFRQFDAVVRLLGQVCRRRPLVMVLDDAHWADRSSMLLIRHIARSVLSERLLLVVSFRPTENAHMSDFAELVREPATRQIELTGLAVPAVAQQLASITGQQVRDAEAHTVHALTGGNPFFVAEVGRVLPVNRIGGAIAPVTSTVREAITARLNRLPLPCVELLRAASIAGQDFSSAVVAAMVDRAVPDCLESLDDAQAAGLIEAGPEPGDHRFVHALVRDAIEAGLGSPERVRLHRRAAGALEALCPRPRPPQLFDLARHWAIAALQGERLTATSRIERAAQEAMRGLAYEEGAHLFRVALSVGRGELDDATECRLQLGLARAAHLSADASGCLDARVAAAALARGIGRTDLLAQAALAADAIGATASELTTQHLCREALDALPVDEVGLRARLTARYAEACIYVAWGSEHTIEAYETGAAASQDALALAEQCGDPAALEAALRARRMACSSPEGLDDREQLAARMLTLGRATGDARTRMRAHLWQVDAAFERGDLARVAREVEALSWCVQEVRGPHARFELRKCQAVLAQAHGRFGEAMRRGAEAFADITLFEDGVGYHERAGLLHQIGLQIGHEASGSLAASGFADTTVFDSPLQTAGVIIAVANAHLLAAVGRRDEARATYRSLGPAAEWQPSPHAVLPALAFGINIAMALDETHDVATLRERLSRYRGHHVVSGAGTVAYFGPVEMWLGDAARHLGLLDDAVTDLDQAVQACATNGAAGYGAQAQYLLATALAQRAQPGDTTRARALLEVSGRQASVLGMGPIQAAADALLRQLVATGPLTRREWEVATLVAKGSTNREIATALHLSERTAQNHVQHILTKLDLANRSQIATWVTQQGMSTGG